MNRPWVIKAGGELMDNPSARKKILKDLLSAHRRHPTVFVHGGGPQIERDLKLNRVPAKFVNGRRATSPAAMTIVEKTLSGLINKGLAAELVSMGALAVGLSCRDGGLVTAKPIPKLGRAARPQKIKPKLLLALLASKILPVVSSVGSDVRGQSVNINADDAASALGTAMKAAHIIFLTNVSGVRDNKGKRIAVLHTGEIDKLISKGVITGGMIPKVQSARAAIKKGVNEVDIVNGFEGINLNKGTRIIR